MLIGRDLILTAGHCFRGRSYNQAEVWFNYSPEGISQGTVTSGGKKVQGPDKYAVAELLAPSVAELSANKFNETLLDFALLRIRTDNENKGAHESWPIQCIAVSRGMERNAPVYLIGHPQRAPRTVHDNSRVFLPFQVDRDGYDVLQADIAADLKTDPDRDRLVSEFVASYRQGVNELNQPVYRLYDVRRGGQPRIGLETDTFEGNSGSPVYDRMGQCIVGLLASGAPDFAAPPGSAASWARHESALPVTAIVAEIDRRLPSWRNLGVVVK